MLKQDCRADEEGRIKMATISAPDLAASERAYADYFGYEVVERGKVSPQLAAAWGAPRQAGSPYVIMGPRSGAQVFVRFIENAAVPACKPLMTFGWAAIEITIQDVEKLNDELLANSPFEVIGPPAYLDFSDKIYPMQAVGPAGDVIYLNQVKGSLPAYDLPMAQSYVDHIFITILASPDMQQGVDFYKNAFGWAQGNSYDVPYSVINKAFGLPATQCHKLSMNCVGRIVNNEVDQYPAETIIRPRHEGFLPPGIAMISFITKSLDAAKTSFITAPGVYHGTPYNGRRSATCIGYAGELVEIIEQA